MLIPNITQQQFDGAIRQFDLLTRNSPAWKDWENQPGNEYVLLYNNKIYPIKFILSNATKIPESDFDFWEAVNYFSNKGGWNVRVQPLEKYLNPVAPVILEIADTELYNYRLLEKRIELFKIGPYKSFTSDFYDEDEREYKEKAVKQHKSTLNKDVLAKIIEQEDFQLGANIIRVNYNKDNLLYKPWEVLPFLNIPDEVLVRNLFNLLYGQDSFEKRLDAWIKLLAKEKPLCWPAATYHLMLHNQDEHIFVKPGTIGKLLGDVGSKLQWQPRTSAVFYFQLQRFSRAILPKLQPLGAKDMLDVQSFSWVMRDQ